MRCPAGWTPRSPPVSRRPTPIRPSVTPFTAIGLFALNRTLYHWPGSARHDPHVTLSPLSQVCPLLTPPRPAVVHHQPPLRARPAPGGSSSGWRGSLQLAFR